MEKVDLSTEAHHELCHTQVSARCKRRIVIAVRWKTIITMLGSLIALFSACGGTPQPVSTASNFPHLRIARYSATVKVQTGKVMSVSVSCKPGEQMLGGGFISSDLFEYAASIEASYPSSAMTWTVTGSAPFSFFDVEAQVYCFQAKVPLGIHIVRATGIPTAKVACPPGTVLLSEGFQRSQSIGVSRPQRNGWMSASAGASIQGYALCAASHVLHGQVVTSVFNPHSSSHSYAPGGSKVVCPAGQVATDGRFEGENVILESHTTGSAFTGWSVAAGGDADMTISAVCVVLQG